MTARYGVQSLFPDIIKDKFAGPLPQSVQQGTNADLVWALRDVYFDNDRTIIDLTYGTEGGWWKRWRPDSLVVSDFDFTNLPFVDGEFQTVCYDPPYVQTGGAATTSSIDRGFRDRFGINDLARSEGALLGLILAGLTEAARITDRSNGFLCVKCMDFVGSGRFCDWSYEVHTAAKTFGMHLYDEVIHNAGSGPGGHNISEAKRARRAHSKLLVFTWKPIR